MLQNLHAQVDQQVAAGAILFDVAEMDPIWVKVSVYVGDLERLATDRPAGVGSLADPPGVQRAGRTARDRTRLGRSPGGDGPSLLPGRESRPALRPGQRVGVTLPLKRRRNQPGRSALGPGPRRPRRNLGLCEHRTAHLRAPTRLRRPRRRRPRRAFHGPKVGAKVVARARPSSTAPSSAG